MRTKIYLESPNMQDKLLRKPTLFAPNPLKHLFYYFFTNKRLKGFRLYSYLCQKIKLRVNINKIYFHIAMKQKVTGKPTAKIQLSV